MAETRLEAPTDLSEPVVHNAGSKSVTVHVASHGDSVVVDVVALEPGESHIIPTDATTRLEVQTPTGFAAALADRSPFFVVSDDRVIVAPE